MQDWLAGENGGQYLTAILWTVAALVLLVVILFIVRILRRASLSFSGGDRANRPRLGLGKSIEVDKQRRLVLVRRDDVEHLILIGGPSDVLIEEGIGRVVASERSERRAEPSVPPPAPRVIPVAATPSPRLAEPATPAPVRTEPAIDTPPRAPVEPMRPRPEPQPAAPVAAPTATEPLHAAPRAHVAPAPLPVSSSRPMAYTHGPEDDDVVEFPRDDILRARAHPAPRQEGSLEDEMSRLLEDISDEKR